MNTNNDPLAYLILSLAMRPLVFSAVFGGIGVTLLYITFTSSHKRENKFILFFFGFLSALAAVLMFVGIYYD